MNTYALLVVIIALIVIAAAFFWKMKDAEDARDWYMRNAEDLKKQRDQLEQRLINIPPPTISYTDGMVILPIPVEKACELWTEMHKRRVLPDVPAGHYTSLLPFTDKEQDLYDKLTVRLCKEATA
jgi:hypothetical protein